MWHPVPLPFYKDAAQIPAPLPTTAEIEDATMILGKRTGQQIIAVGEHFIVKHGTGVSILEGQNLLFVEQNLSVVAPRLYAMYEDPRLGFVLIMELIKGESLLEAWPSLSAQDKGLIMSKIRDFRTRMQAIQQPTSPFYGSVTNGPMPDHLFWSPEEDNTRNGPFTTEEELNNALVKQLQAIDDQNQRPSHKARYYSRTISTILHGHRPTFTHADIQRKNIVVQKITGDIEDKQHDFSVAFIDWEFAGWYPDYWEHFSSFAGFTWMDDWDNYLTEKGLDIWPGEVAVMMMIYHDLVY